MSKIVSRGSDPDPKVKFLSIALAVVLVLFWGFLIAGTWWFFGNRDNTLAGGIVNWVARFHVLLVHIPVGLIFLVIALEVVGKAPGFHHIRESTTFILWMTLLGALGATILGYLLMEVEEIAGKAMTLHLWTGLAVVGFSLLSLIFKLKGHGFIYGLSLILCALSVAAAGHYGGAMVHGADYLSEYAPPPVKSVMLAGLSSGHEEEDSLGLDETAEVMPEEKNVYADYVHPILEKACNDCHNENKIKGKLRMDTHDLLMAGADGSDYPTVVPGDPDESELIVRVTLPSDDDDFMPPKGDGLTKEEINLINLWIVAGARTDTTIAQLGDDPSIEATLAAVDFILAGQEVEEVAMADTWQSLWDALPPAEQEARLATAQTEAEKLNISVMPVSAEDDRLHVNVLNGAAEFGDEQILALEPVADRVAWLNLAKSQITDEGMKVVGKMRGLEKLHLENTKITDTGIAELTQLKQLEYLNLYATGVSNSIFETLREMPAVRKLYVWQTQVDPAEARRYEKSVNLEINTGVDLEKAAAEGRRKKDEEEAAKAVAQKKIADADAAKKKTEEEAKKLAAAEAKRKADAAAAAAKKKAAEEAARKQKEAEAVEKVAKPEPAVPAPVSQ